MNKTLLYIVFFSILSLTTLDAQEFQMAFEDFNVSNDFSQDTDGNLITVGYTTFFFEASIDKVVSLDIINKLDPEGQWIWSRDFEIEGVFTEIHKVISLEDGSLIALFSIDEENQNTQIGILSVSADGNLQWSKKIQAEVAGFDGFNFELNLIKGSDDSFYVQSKKTNNIEQVHILSFFNKEGQVQWTKAYPSDLKIVLSTMVGLDNGDLALVGFHRTGGNQLIGIVAILDEEGNIKATGAYENIQALAIFAIDDSYILKCKITGSNRLGFIRLNAELDVEWSKQYTFEIEGQLENMQKMNDESFAVYCYNPSQRTELINLIDMNGDLIWSRSIVSKYSGRPFFEKIINSNDNILLMSHIWTGELKASIFRQMPLDGNTEQCVLPPACINPNSFETLRLEFPLEQEEAAFTELPVSILLTPVTKATMEFCREPEDIPSPIFDIPETACASEFFEVSNPRSEGADEISWLISGGPDNAILPLNGLNLGLPISFPDTGLYTITQIIEVNNCPSTFEKDIEIKDGFPFSFRNDTIILCQNEEKTVNVSRPGILTYLWLDDLSPNPIKKISVAGSYTVEIYDGSCTSQHTLEAVDFDFSQVAFDLGPDTTVCEFRTFTLEPDLIAPNTDYIWNDGPKIASRPANKEGLYTLTAVLDGCDFVDDILVSFESCEPQIYMPSIFTPNADGINDELFPQGINYELLTFRIYNRWGALLHDDITPWDGEFRNQKVQGSYIYNIRFLNERSGDVEYLTGEVFMHP